MVLVGGGLKEWSAQIVFGDQATTPYSTAVADALCGLTHVLRKAICFHLQLSVATPLSS